MKEIISREEAIASGKRLYFTGKPCKNGHVSERIASTGKCSECKRQGAKAYARRNPEKNKQYRERNVEKLKAYMIEYRAKNADAIRENHARYASENADRRRAVQKEYRAREAEKIKARKRARYEKNKDEIKQKVPEYRIKNQEKVRVIASNWYKKNAEMRRAESRRYYKDNPEKFIVYRLRRSIREKIADPGFDTELTEFVSSEGYALARLRLSATGILWHLDHMIPLRAKSASGLHTWNNLQVIPKALNQKKRNRIWLTHPGEWVRSL